MVYVVVRKKEKFVKRCKLAEKERVWGNDCPSGRFKKTI